MNKVNLYLMEVFLHPQPNSRCLHNAALAFDAKNAIGKSFQYNKKDPPLRNKSFKESLLKIKLFRSI